MRMRLIVCMLSAMVLSACERLIPADEEAATPAAGTGGNVILRVGGMEQIPFNVAKRQGIGLADASTRAAQDIGELCSRISFAVFEGEKKVKVVHQKLGDASFGTAAFSLEDGTYQVAVFAHSGESSVSIPSLDKMTANRRVTDTFLYYGELKVSGTETITRDVQLQRRVAMFRLVITDEIPATAAFLWFQYKGGSSTLSALTGYGSVNSTQTEIRTISSGQRQFDIYTFPHDEDDVLNITLRVFDAGENMLAECEFEDVPVTRNQITRYTGAVFSSQGASASSTFRLTADGEWGGETAYPF